MAPALSAEKNSVVLLLQDLKELQPQTLPPLILMKHQEVLLLHLLLMPKELEITLKGGLQSLLVALEDSQDLFSLHLTRCSPLLGQAAAQEVVRAADQRVDHRQTRTTRLLLPNPGLGCSFSSHLDIAMLHCEQVKDFKDKPEFR